MSCEDIPSLLDLQKVKKHADDFGRLMGTGTGTSTNGVTGQVRPTYNKVIEDLGFKPGSGDFTTGFTVMPGERDIAWKNPSPPGDNNFYSWDGPIPPTGKFVPAGSTPETTGGVIAGAWRPRTDETLRYELARLNVGAVSELSALTSSDVGKRVQWLGYYLPSDGGSNWGIVKSGAHVHDGGSIFTINTSLYVEANTKGKKITLKKFGCKQDGITDDTKQFYKAVEFAINNSLILDCCNLPTLVQDTTVKTFVSTMPVRIHNLNLVAGTTYANQPRLKFDSDVEYEIKNLKVTGGRGTKAGLEPWAKFTAFLGYDSIEPATGNLITIGGSLLTSDITIDGVDARDCHYDSIILAFTSGVIDAKRFHFENCSNKQIHFWHGIDGGSQPLTGVTNLCGYVAKNCGILPASFTVDGVTKTRADAVAPQGAFGCIVSYGTFNHSDIFIYNYGSTGVTPDRNITAMGRNVKIWHDDPNGFSNNSSGAYWDEYCGNCEVDGLEIKISARDPRETPLENCALQIFKQTSGIFSATNVVIETSGTASIDKDIRGSLGGGSQVSINGYSLESNASNTSISVLQTVGASAKIELRGGRVRGAPMRITQSQNLIIDLLDSDQNLLIDQSLPAPLGDVGLYGVKCKTVTVNGLGGTLEIVGGSTDGVIVGGAGGKMRLDGGLFVDGVTYATGLRSATVGNIETSRRLELVDVEFVKLSPCILKTDQPEACLTLSPSAPGIMKHVSAIGVSRWIKTGTSGAGYVSTNVNVGSFSDISPDDKTFDFT